MKSMSLKQVTYRFAPLGVVLSSVVVMRLLPLAMGHLAQQLGISFGDAMAIVGFIVAAGASAGPEIALVFPFVLPFLATVEGLIIAVGVTAAAGW